MEHDEFKKAHIVFFFVLSLFALFAFGMMIFEINKLSEQEDKICYPNIVLTNVRINNKLYVICAAEETEYRIVKLKN